MTFITFLFVSVVTTILAFLWIYVFRKMKLLDKPGKDLKWVRKPVPTMQWIVVFLIFLIIVSLFYPDMWMNKLFLWFLAWWSLIFVVETITELEYIWKIKFKISPKVRFLVHLIAACFALWISWMSDFEILLWWYALILPQRALYVAFAVWSAFITNAVNWIDWINAQGNWILTIGFFTVFGLIQWVVFPSYTEYTNYETLIFVQKLSIILAIISLVYTVVEFKPFALIRDIWTMFLAFWLAYLSVLWWAKFWTLIVALSLVIFDAVWIIFYRIFVLKKSPMQWDYKHMHHRLLRLWWTRWEIRAFVWIWSVVMMILMLIQWTNRSNKIVIFMIMALLFFWVNTYLFLVKKLPCGQDDKKEDHFDEEK